MFGFGNNDGTQAPATQAPAQAAASTEPQAGDPAAVAATAQAEPAAEPQGIDKFAKLWDNPANEADTGDGNNPPKQGLALSQDVLSPIAAKLDFTRGLNPETLQTVMQGDLSKLPDLLNEVARSAYSQSMEHSTGLVNSHLDTRFSEFSDSVNTQTQQTVKDAAIQNTIQTDNPVVRGELQRVATQLQKQNPDATPDWIRQQSEAYLTELSSALNPASQAQSAGNGNQPEATDYMQMLTGKSN